MPFGITKNIQIALKRKYPDNHDEWLWFKIAKEILKRDKYRCQKCGRYGYHVHHIKPVSKHPDLVDDPTNLITYCKDCHLKTGLHKEVV
jgi:5-methylcytosine-specific restriction endonuclease McrA